MRVTFVAHSGFLVELPSVALLFDWWKGELPALRPGVPLLVFASHRHEDHFKPEIFRLDAHAFLLGRTSSSLPGTGRNGDFPTKQRPNASLWAGTRRSPPCPA